MKFVRPFVHIISYNKIHISENINQFNSILGDNYPDFLKLMFLIEEIGYKSFKKERKKFIVDENKSCVDKYLLNIIKNGKISILEQFSIGFFFKNVSKSFLSQLNKSGFGKTVSEQNLRYNKVKDICFVYFNNETYKYLMNNYKFLQSIENNFKNKLNSPEFDNPKNEEDKIDIAINLLPMCTATEIFWTCNLKELFYGIRLGTASYSNPEMRTIFNRVKMMISEFLFINDFSKILKHF